MNVAFEVQSIPVYSATLKHFVLLVCQVSIQLGIQVSEQLDLSSHSYVLVYTMLSKKKKKTFFM